MSEELKARIAELEHRLAESRDFAISETARIRTEYESQQAVLIEELRQIEHSMNQAKVLCIELPPAKKADVMINGLTEAETSVTASVAGLMGGA